MSGAPIPNRRSESSVVLVLGAAGRVGGSIVRRANAEGISLILADIDQDALQQRFGGSGFPLLQVDAGDDAAVSGLPDRLEDLGMNCRGVVNACYPPLRHALTDTRRLSRDQFLEDVKNHLATSFTVCRTFGDYFAASGGGTVITLSSIYGLRAPRFEIYLGQSFTMPVSYAVAKAGVRTMSAYFAQLLKKERVRFNCVSPGGILDDHNDAFRAAYGAHAGSGDLLSADDVSGVVCFLLSEGARAITGQDIAVDEGWTL